MTENPSNNPNEGPDIPVPVGGDDNSLGYQGSPYFEGSHPNPSPESSVCDKVS